MSQSARAYYDSLRQKPFGQGLIGAVRFSEGTEGPQGYRTMFGGGQFDSYAAHPDRVVNANGYSSAAAGAGQFMPKTWAGIQQALGETDFSPAAQERGILYLADQRLKPIGGLAALEKEGFSPRVSELLAPEWASFPTRSGKSYYGQPVKPLAEIQAAFARRNPGAAVSGPTPQPRATESPGGSPEDQFLAALSDPARLTRPRAAATQADDFEVSDVPGLGDLTNPLDGIWKAIAAGTLGGGLASRLGLPRAIASNPAADLTLQGELKRRQAAQVLADAYTIMNPNINLSDLMQSSSRQPSKPRNDFLTSLMSDESSDNGVRPVGMRPGGNPQVIEYPLEIPSTQVFGRITAAGTITSTLRSAHEKRVTPPWPNSRQQVSRSAL